MYNHTEIDFLLLDDIYGTDIIELEQPCLICWQDKSLINLYNYPNIVKSCKCQGNFHKKCLATWFSKSSSCPLCRKKVSFDIYSDDFLHIDTFNKLPLYVLFFLITVSFINVIYTIYIFIK